MDVAETTKSVFDWLPTLVGLVGVVVGAASFAGRVSSGG